MKGISKSLPFLPLSAARVPRAPVASDVAVKRFKRLQQVYNGEPQKYERKYKESYREALDKLEEIYAQYPPASPEVIEAHRRLGYPEHYIQALETGNYKFITQPTTKPNGEKDWRSFEDYWSFDPLASSNISAEKAFDKIANNLNKEHASGRGLRFVPALDFGKLADSTRLIPDVVDGARSMVDRLSEAELKVNGDAVRQVWTEYTSAGEGSVADAVMDLVKEKETEVRYARRMALVQWMQARGDIDHWDLVDFMPRQRDEVLAREDETGFFSLKLVLPDVEESSAQQIHSWNDFKELLRAQRADWDEADEQEALGGAVTEAAELQRRIDTIMQKDSSSAAGKEGGEAGAKGEKKRDLSLELVLNQEKIEKEAVLSMSDDANRLPMVAQSLLHHMFGEDYKAKWAEAQKANREKAASVKEAQ